MGTVLYDTQKISQSTLEKESLTALNYRTNRRSADIQIDTITFRLQPLR
jgi:hypothetical protein